MKIKKVILILLFLFIFGIVYFVFHLRQNDIAEQNYQINKNSIAQENSPNSEDKDVIVVELSRKEDSYLNLSIIGDIMCHNSQYVDAYIPTQNTYDFSYVFEDIKEHIENADLAIGNLETTFAGKEKGYSNYPLFNTPEQLANNLKDFGIDVLSTANNHCMDSGYNGLASTLNYLDEAGISHVGTNRSMEEQNTILIKEVNGFKIAFLSFTYGTNGITIPEDKKYCVNLIDETFILSQIDIAKQYKPDLICASMHWGIEYQNQPNETQQNLANLLFENGVDLIFGSHPHVLQPMEKKTITQKDGREKECFVIYSLGNFMSGQTKQYTRSSIILKINLKKEGYGGKISIENISYVPIYMHKSSANGKKYRILDMEKSINSYETGANLSIGKDVYSTLKSEVSRIHTLMGENY